MPGESNRAINITAAVWAVIGTLPTGTASCEQTTNKATSMAIVAIFLILDCIFITSLIYYKKIYEEKSKRFFG